MKAHYLEFVSPDECCRVCGGADKNAQNALYYIGYAIGFIIRCIANLFGGREPKVEVEMEGVL
ncbi:MAG: hypothetical protein J5693_01605 [Bacteroidales bacterium]|nr:hypothetical protein [Bacteroidales bacterium]